MERKKPLRQSFHSKIFACRSCQCPVSRLGSTGPSRLRRTSDVAALGRGIAASANHRRRFCHFTRPLEPARVRALPANTEPGGSEPRGLHRLATQLRQNTPELYGESGAGQHSARALERRTSAPQGLPSRCAVRPRAQWGVYVSLAPEQQHVFSQGLIGAVL